MPLALLPVAAFPAARGRHWTGTKRTAVLIAYGLSLSLIAAKAIWGFKIAAPVFVEVPLLALELIMLGWAIVLLAREHARPA